ncbi:uncharacterized protein LOC128997523 [Macrosteles quadrilineatus]|uniref:uncharacterized protein LOC128997523 n=1 Tax=Macrosteles quadrilineatus TaxID=74068 RepID=UPI0023E11298|nr:uncharacterized protein LOC128997523 [Macrosteles quadrilineatus]
MRNGVRCFHLDRFLKLLVTGGQDGILRLWNPVITYRPTVSLFGHKSCIIDVRALKHLRVILSMSKDAVLKVWDIEEQSCLQSLSTLFPVFGLLSRTPHFGVQVFYPGPVCHDPPTTSVRDKPTLQTKLQTTHPASLLSTSSTTRQDRASVYRNEGEWNRMEILAVCCDYIMILQLSQRELSEGEGRVGEALPPPLREQEPAVPSPWLTVDSVQMSTLNVDHPSQLSSGSEATSPIPTAVLETFQRSFGDEVTYHFKGLTSANHNIKAAKARQYTAQKDVRSMIEQCAPHLVLNLSPLEEIRFTHPLPTTSRMRNIDLSNPDKLLKARLKRDSTSTVGSKASNTSTTSSTLRSKKRSS